LAYIHVSTGKQQLKTNQEEVYFVDLSSSLSMTLTYIHASDGNQQGVKNPTRNGLLLWPKWFLE